MENPDSSPTIQPLAIVLLCSREHRASVSFSLRISDIRRLYHPYLHSLPFRGQRNPSKSQAPLSAVPARHPLGLCDPRKLQRRSPPAQLSQFGRLTVYKGEVQPKNHRSIRPAVSLNGQRAKGRSSGRSSSTHASTVVCPMLTYYSSSYT